MASFVLRFKNSNETPIQEIAGRVKAALTGTLTDLTTIGEMTQAPSTLEIEILSTFKNPVKVAQTLKGKLGPGVSLEAIE